jgi:hypothetical protein
MFIMAEARETWDASRRGGRFETSYETAAFVNGATIQLEAGANFKDTVIRLAADAGMGKFKAYLNGTEVKPSQAPETIQAGDRLEVMPYDVAGR